jgi:hypothetical protein
MEGVMILGVRSILGMDADGLCLVRRPGKCIKVTVFGFYLCCLGYVQKACNIVIAHVRKW